MFLFFCVWAGLIGLYSVLVRFRNLSSVWFWLIVWWSLVFGVTLATDASWIHKPSIISFGYLLLCFLMFYVGNRVGERTKVELPKEPDRIVNPRQLHIYKYIAYLGLAMFVLDYYRINGFTYTSRTYEISAIGAFGNLMIPALLPIGLYEVGYGIKEQRKVRFGGVFALFCYALPGIISHGREAIVFVVISCLSLVSMCLKQSKETFHIPPKYKKFIVVILFFVVVVVYFVLQKTRIRFTANDISTFVYYHPLPSESRREVEQWGEFAFLYYAIAWYFGTQLPYLEFILKRYRGPYVLGAYEFNIISRRLPMSWGLNTEAVSSAQRQLFAQYGESFSALWPGFPGSLIFDYGRIGTLVVICVLGVFVGKITKKCRLKQSLQYQVAVSLLCMMMFTTIQMGPLFQYNVWSTMIWWMIMLGDKRIRIVFNGRDI